ncbi:hypothetical protein JKP88DRAFT_148939, partial [Tribonema minus]
LPDSITCDQQVAALLTPETVERVKQIVPALRKHDPGLVVQVQDRLGVHQALQLPYSPV